MKKLYTITTALLMLAGTFTSCTKDLDEVGLNATSIDAAKKEVKPTNNGSNAQSGEIGNDKVLPVITVTYNQSPALVNTPVTMTITVAEPAGYNHTLTSGNLILERSTPPGWVEEAKSENEKAAPTLIHTFTPTSVGTINWRVKYTGGGKHFENFNTPTQLEVVNSCQKTEINGQLIDTKAGDGYTLFTVKYTLNSCINITGAKVQGGLTAYTELVSATDSNGNNSNVSEPGKSDNSIISWNLGNIGSGYSNSFTVVFKNTKKDPSGEITGVWSVEGKNDEGGEVKYTTPALIN